MARIQIKDLPPVQDLTPEELAEIFGAGRTRLGVEQLETRELRAASLMASLSGGVLRVEGTTGSDQIRIQQSNNQISVQGISIQTNTGVQSAVAASALSRIDIASLDGSDQIWLGDSSHLLGVPVNLGQGSAGDLLYAPQNPAGINLGSSAVKALQGSDGNVVALNANGDVAVNGSVVWNNKADIALDASNRLYLLERGGTDLWRSKLTYGSGGWDVLSNRASRLVQGTQGYPLALTWDGSILRLDNGQKLGDGFTDAVQDPTGNLFALDQKGVIWRSAGTTGGNWQVSGYTFRKILLDPQGNLLALAGDGIWRLPAGQTSGWAKVSDTFLFQDMAVDPLGNLTGLDSSGVARRSAGATGGNWQALGSTFQKIVLDPQGNLLALASNGVWRLPAGPNASWQHFTSASLYKDMAMDSRGNLVTLDSNGVIWSSAGATGANWVDLGYTFQKIALDPQGNLFGLSAGQLWRSAGATGGNWQAQIDGGRGFQDFAIDARGNLYAPDGAGVVWRSEGANGGNWLNMGRPAAGWQAALTLNKFDRSSPAGTAFALMADGWVYLNGQPEWNNARDIAVAPDGSLYKLDMGGSLDQLTLGVGWTNVGLGITALGLSPAGVLLDTDSSGTLTITGTVNPDTIILSETSGRLSATGIPGSFDATQINKIVINGLGGNDLIRLDSESVPGQQVITVPALIHGGDGADTIIGGGGNDQLFGDAGNDLLTDHLGDNLLDGGDGNDTITAGSNNYGNNTLRGGSGNDNLTATSTTPFLDAPQKVLAQAPYQNGLVTAYGDGSIWYSPDGQNLYGGGNSVQVYSGMLVRSLIAWKGGLITAFANGSVYYAPTPSAVAGAGNGQSIYNGAVVNGMAALPGGVVTAFADGSIYYTTNPTGQTGAIAGAGTGVRLYTGSAVTAMIAYQGTLITSFATGQMYQCTNPQGVAGGSSDAVSVGSGLVVKGMLNYQGGILTQFSDGSVYYSPDGKGLAGQTSTTVRLTGSNTFATDSGDMISDTTQTNGHNMHAAVFNEWLSLGGKSGPLGAPTADELDSPYTAGVRYVTFQGGVVFWTAQYGAHALTGAMWQKWNSLSVAQLQAIGGATADAATYNYAGGVSYVSFQGGVIFSTSSGTRVLTGPIWQKFNSLSAAQLQVLGAPTSDETTTTSGSQVTFQNGTIVRAACGTCALIGTSVAQTALGLAPGGQPALFALDGNGHLYCVTAAGGQQLDNGILVTRIAAGTDELGHTSLFVLFQDGSFYTYNQAGFTNLKAINRVLQAAAGVDYSGNPALFVLYNGGSLWRYNGILPTDPATRLDAPGSPALRIAAGSDDRGRTGVFALFLASSPYNLYLYRSDGAHNLTSEGDATQSVADTDTSGKLALLILYTSGSTWSYTGANPTDPAQLLGNGGVQLADGSIAFLYGSTAYQLSAKALNVIATGVQALTNLGNGNVGLLFGGNLYSYGARGLNQLLANVQSLSPVGTSIQIQIGPYLSAQTSVQIDPNTGSASLNFTGVQLNLDAFIGSVLGPIIQDVQKVTMPMESIAQTLLAPVPVLSTISQAIGGGNVTLASLIGDPDLTTFANAVEAINSLPATPTGAGTIALGSFTASTSLGGGVTSLVNSAVDDIGQEVSGPLATFLQDVGMDNPQPPAFNLPVLSNPSLFFQIMVGQNVNLFSYSLPTISYIPGTLTQNLGSFPVFFGVSVDISATENISVQAGATFGCDSSGLLSGQPLTSFYVQNAHLNASVTVGLTASAVGGVDGVADVKASLTANLSATINVCLANADGSTTVYANQLPAATTVVSGAITGALSLDVTLDLFIEHKTDNIWGTGQTTFVTFG
jgi:hypothetical protein